MLPSGSSTVSDGSTVLASSSLWSATVDPNLTYDPEAREVSFTDPFDGQVVVTFTLDELADLELAANEKLGRPSLGERTVLLTSPDACTWTTQELTLPDRNINWAAIYGDRLALSVGSRFSPGGPQLWWANLPKRGSGNCR